MEEIGCAMSESIISIEKPNKTKETLKQRQLFERESNKHHKICLEYYCYISLIVMTHFAWRVIEGRDQEA
jgi:hypothetical protein